MDDQEFRRRMAITLVSGYFDYVDRSDLCVAGFDVNKTFWSRINALCDAEPKTEAKPGEASEKNPACLPCICRDTGLGYPCACPLHMDHECQFSVGAINRLHHVMGQWQKRAEAAEAKLKTSYTGLLKEACDANEKLHQKVNRYESREADARACAEWVTGLERRLYPEIAAAAARYLAGEPTAVCEYRINSTAGRCLSRAVEGTRYCAEHARVSEPAPKVSPDYRLVELGEFAAALRQDIAVELGYSHNGDDRKKAYGLALRWLDKRVKEASGKAPPRSAAMERLREVVEGQSIALQGSLREYEDWQHQLVDATRAVIAEHGGGQ